MNQSADDMPSLECASDCVRDDTILQEEDGTCIHHANEVPSQHEAHQSCYPQDARTVQYKASPLRNSSQGPHTHREAPTVASAQGDSISEMGIRQGTRGCQAECDILCFWEQ